jgi:hypothetical protein
LIKCYNINGGSTKTPAFVSEGDLYSFTNSSTNAPSVLVTGLCSNKVVNSQTYSITYTNTNSQTYTYTLAAPTLSGSYYSTTYNDNNFNLPTGSYTMQINGWCGFDTINSFITKTV